MLEKIIWSIIEVLSEVAEVSIVFLYFNGLLKSKYQNYLYYYIAYLFSVIILSTVYLRFSIGGAKIACIILVMVIIAFLLYEGKFYFKIYNFRVASYTNSWAPRACAA